MIILQMTRLFEDYKQARGNKMNVKRTQTFFNKLDIYKCSGGEACLDQKLCSGFHVRCKCLEEFEIPIQEVAFFKDQREKIKRDGGKMTMEGKDIINA